MNNGLSKKQLLTERDKYVRQIFETVHFFRDMYEERNDGKTTAIQLLKPPDLKSVRNTAIRKFVLYECYRTRKLTLTEAAFELAKWQPEEREIPPFSIQEIEADLRALCFSHEREFQFDLPEEDVKRRSYLRAARYIQRIVAEDAPAHSRVVELFIPDDFVPWGHGRNGAGHREHVVPCVLLRDKCIDSFKNAATLDLDQVADFLKRHVVIVEITKQEQEKLDKSKLNEGVGLKHKMPDGWDWDTGCIFARLHEAKIEFVPPKGCHPCDH